MKLPSKSVLRGAALVAAVALATSLAACTGFMATRTQGYEISESDLVQIRPGQSADLVVAVLGSPQTTNTFGQESAFYYVETRVSQTAFGMTNIESRKVLAIYFDDNDRVIDKALYGLEDGKVVDIEARRTPSFGQDRTFIESIIDSI